MMEPGTERELDYTERLFKKMPGWAVTATLFIGRMLIRVGRAGKKLWNCIDVNKVDTKRADT